MCEFSSTWGCIIYLFIYLFSPFIGSTWTFGVLSLSLFVFWKCIISYNIKFFLRSWIYTSSCESWAVYVLSLGEIWSGTHLMKVKQHVPGHVYESHPSPCIAAQRYCVCCPSSLIIPSDVFGKIRLPQTQCGFFMQEMWYEATEDTFRARSGVVTWWLNALDCLFSWWCYLCFKMFS